MVVSPKIHYPLMMSENRSFQVNGVNEARLSFDGESLTPGRCSMALQRGTGRHQCYLRSEPGVMGSGKRIHELWVAKDLFVATKQMIVEQEKQIRKNRWLSKLELEDMQRNVDDVQHGVVGPKPENEQMTDNEHAEEHVENEKPNQDQDSEHYEKLQVYPDYELSEEEQESLLSMEILKRERTRLPSLRGINKGEMKAEVKKVDMLLGKIEVRNITTTNDIIYAGAGLVTEMIGANKQKSKEKEPWLKRRLEKQVKEMNKDLGRINTLLEKTNKEEA